jgi:hypothetical protein
MGLITHIVTYLTVMKPVREAKAQLWAVASLMMIMMKTVVATNVVVIRADIVVQIHLHWRQQK